MSADELCRALRADVATLHLLVVGQLRDCDRDARHVFDDMERRVTSSTSVFSTSEADSVLECILSAGEGSLLRFVHDRCEKLRVAGADAWGAGVLKRAMTFLKFVVASFCESLAPLQLAEVQRTAWHTFMLLHHLSKHTETQAECLSVMVALLQHCGHCTATVQMDVAKVVDVCVPIAERRAKSGMRLKSNALRLLGCVCAVYTAAMSSHAARVLDAMVHVGQQLAATEVVEQLVGEGLLLAFADYTGGFPLMFNGPDRDTLRLMHCLTRKAMGLAEACQNYRFCKAALALLGRRAGMLKECLIEDMESCFAALKRLWCHRNVEVRRATYDATAGFFQALALLRSDEDQRHDPAARLRSMLQDVEATLQNNHQRRRDLSFAIMAIGYMARPLTVCFGLDYLAVTFREMVNKCEVLLTLASGPVEDVVQLLPYILTALASMLLELPPMGPELPQLLNVTLYTTLFLYPQDACFEHVRSTLGPALLKLLAVISQRHRVEFGVGPVARQLLALACSPMLFWDPQTGPSVEAENVAVQQRYIRLWGSLQSNRVSVVDWGFPWSQSLTDATLNLLRLALRRELVLAEREMLQQLDLLRLRGEAQAGDGCDLNVYSLLVRERGHPRSCNEDYHIAFPRFVAFFTGSLDATFSHVFGAEEVTISLIEGLVLFTTRCAHLADGYSCLHALMRVGRQKGLSLRHADIFLRPFSRACLHRLPVLTGEVQLQCARYLLSVSHLGLLETAQLLDPIEVVLRRAGDRVAVADALDVLECCLEKDCTLVMPPFCRLLRHCSRLNLAFGQLHAVLARHMSQLTDDVQCGLKVCLAVEGSRDTFLALPDSHWHTSGAQLPLPLADTTLCVSLDVLLPHVTVLSSQAEDPQVRRAACDIIHAAVGWCIHNGIEELYSALFDTVVALAAATVTDTVVREMFAALLRHCTRWFAQRDGRGAKEMERALCRGATATHDTSVRRLATETLVAYVQWSLNCSSQLQPLQGKDADESQVGRVLHWTCVTLREASVWCRLGAADVLGRLLRVLRDERGAMQFVIPFARALLDAFAFLRVNAEEEEEEDETAAAAAEAGEEGKTAVTLAGKLCCCVRLLELLIAANHELPLRVWRDWLLAGDGEAVLRDILLHAYREGRNTTSAAALLRLFAAMSRCMPGDAAGDYEPRRWLLTHHSILCEFGRREPSPGRRVECGLQMYALLVSSALWPLPSLKRMRDGDAASDLETSKYLSCVLDDLGCYLAELRGVRSDAADNTVRDNDNWCTSARALFIARHLVLVLRGDAGTVTGALALNKSLQQFAVHLLLAPASLGILPGLSDREQRRCGRDLVAALAALLQAHEGHCRALVDRLRGDVFAVLRLTTQPTLLKFFLSDPHAAVHQLRCIVALAEVGLWAEVLGPPSSSHLVLRRLLADLAEAARDEFVISSQRGILLCHTLLLLLLPLMPPPPVDDAAMGQDGERLSAGVTNGIGLCAVLAALQQGEGDDACGAESVGSGFLAAILRGDWREADKNSPTFCCLLTQLCQLCGELLRDGGEASLQSAPFVALCGLLQDVQHGPTPTADTWALIMRHGVDVLMRLVRGASPAVLLFFLGLHRCCLRLGGSRVLAVYEDVILADVREALDDARWTLRSHALLTSRVAVQLFVQGVGVLCDAVSVARVGGAWPTQQYVVLAQWLLPRVVNDELPLDWRELAGGGVNGVHYTLVVNAVIRLATCTATLDAGLLLPLIPLLHQTEMPRYNALATAVAAVLRQLPSKALVGLCHQAQAMQRQGCGLPWAAWWGLTHRLLLPSLHRLVPAQRGSFLLQHVVRLVAEAGAPPDSTATLQQQTRALLMLEAVFLATAEPVLRGPFNVAFTGKREGNTGRELILALIKTCCAARAFVPPVSPSPDAFYEALTYRQSAHRCLAAILTATQDQEPVFTRLLLHSSSGGELWNHIVDTSRKHFFHVEAQFPHMAESMAKDCSDWEMRRCAVPLQRPARSGLQVLRQPSDGELRRVRAVASVVDHTLVTAHQPRLNHARVTHDDSEDATHDGNSEAKETTPPRVRLDGVWISTCSGALLRVMDFLLSRFAVNPAQGWVKATIACLSSTTVHVNARLALARLVQLRASLFAPAANAFRDAVVSLVCVEEVGEGGVHYVARDLLELLLHWGETGAMKFTADAAHTLMEFLLRSAPHPSEAVMQRNLDLARRLLSLAKPIPPLRDAELLRVLRGEVLAARFGLQLCGLLVESGVLLASLAPAPPVELYHALMSYFRKNKTVNAGDEKDVLTAAEVVGKELCGLRDLAATAALLCGAVQDALLCLWSHSPGAALRALRAVAQHDAGVLAGIPLATLLANFMSRDAAEQVMTLHLLRWIPTRAVETYARLQDLFSAHCYALHGLVRAELYHMLVELLPLLAAPARASLVDVFLSPDAMRLMRGCEQTSMAFFSLVVGMYAVTPSSVLLSRVMEGLNDPSPSVRRVTLAFLDAHMLPRDSYMSRLATLKDVFTLQEMQREAWLQHTAVLMLLLCPAAEDLVATPASSSTSRLHLLKEVRSADGVSHDLCPCVSCGGFLRGLCDSNEPISSSGRAEGEEWQEAAHARASLDCFADNIVGCAVPPESFVAPLQVLCLHDVDTAWCCLEPIKEAIPI
ncbi:putative phosphatidylinositol 3-/4-kinase [Trypanosoma rangeli]|uniref:Putative phosphatidylinositol 3-/4-kinase n=1 Tax=Trypanosoma rangeli TaxID=5698 RepID=A0A3R7RLF4_TRYRA|nr:putative phosphatidylinositol 3-/4-kinase [Trypanosoma rangeli]RNF06464.1 putative phosphatidylinositol 3-/4-kinase [Trypanosoma rangeli]|eukprot:RNF06464.1 putative phosphatidylinositol 3-/4-kinase [Trypanosoma rangeli]